MTVANGSQHSMSYVAETTFGTTPSSPTLTPLRHTGTTLGLSKDALESQELRGDRQTQDVRHGNKSNAGDVSVELSYGSFDDFIEALLGGTWSTQVDTSAITADAASGTFTRSTGSFVSDGFAVYDVVTSSGYSNSGNNGRFLVTAVTATVLTVTALEGQTMATESGDGDEQFIAEANVRVGSTRRRFTIERKFDDITQYLRYTGCNINTMSLDIAPGAIVTGTFGVIGKGQTTGASALSGSSYSAETTTSPFDSFTGSIKDNGSDIAVVTSINLNIDNGMNPLYVVGSAETLEPSIGRCRISGTMEVFFEDTTILDKFINETESTIQFTLTDTAGNDYVFYLPRVKYNSGQPDVAGEDPVTLSVEFSALYDTDFNNSIVIDRVPA